MVGVIGAIGGGMLRDVILSLPFSFLHVGTLYAVAAGAGTGVLILLAELGTPIAIAGVACVVVTTLMRLAAVRFDWTFRSSSRCALVAIDASFTISVEDSRDVQATRRFEVSVPDLPKPSLPATSTATVAFRPWTSSRRNKPTSGRSRTGQCRSRPFSPTSAMGSRSCWRGRSRTRSTASARAFDGTQDSR